MANLTASQRNKLMHDLKLVIADAEELLRLTANQAGDDTVELRTRVQDRIKQAKAELLHLQEVAVDKVKAAGQATEEFVHENPWRSIGVAAGVGLVIGMLIGRR